RKIALASAAACASCWGTGSAPSGAARPPDRVVIAAVELSLLSRPPSNTTRPSASAAAAWDWTGAGRVTVGRTRIAVAGWGPPRGPGAPVVLGPGPGAAAAERDDRDDRHHSGQERQRESSALAIAPAPRLGPPRRTGLVATAGRSLLPGVCRRHATR